MLPVSPRSNRSEQQSSSDRLEEIPWNQLTVKLQSWMTSMRRAQACGHPETVLKLMEGLVSFMECGYGRFLHIIMSGSDARDNLVKEGAPTAFIDTFLDVLNTVSLGNATLLYFGVSSNARRTLRASFRTSTDPSTSDPVATRTLPTRSQLAERANAADSSVALFEAHELATITSLKERGSCDAVTVRADELPIDVCNGLAKESAVPFVVIRWINYCYAEILFCVEYASVSYVCGRRVVYVGARPGTQVEGLPTLEGPPATPMLSWRASLPWHSVADLLGDQDTAV